ncbi:uncharacterized protein B0H18DRAFT_976726 [Fomitopsis serialis]|uniref:uncharacterized protein n=1 Tax=Fomitopsis serialis TaxID=139415 RepID=UPI002007378F|nr:uncharacterized protein B0H18DRAFT_976726 [Neoantrodia serialis]KAH9935659.1 hypothetical protein B0H18DRAFT_976726 [Neoantrodia serialis]
MPFVPSSLPGPSSLPTHPPPAASNDHDNTPAMPSTSLGRQLRCWLILAPALWAASARAAGSGTGSTNTSLAMIILYAITGCVSALFCVVIVSGAIRAIRHPERYGPRTGEGEFASSFPGQSRARGLTRAILDTFPVVKFGMETPQSTQGKDVEMGDVNSYKGDEERDSASLDGDDKFSIEEDGGAEPHRGAHANAHERRVSWAPQPPLERKDEGRAGEDTVQEEDITTTAHDHSGTGEPVAGPSSPTQRSPSDRELPPARPRPRPGRSSTLGRPMSAPAGEKEKDVVPDAIGTETCPICIVDFEEGDDLRVLPCEGKHRFHRDCVDQWLLELSSSCPICRQDFQALETMMMAGDVGDHLEPPHPHYAQRPLSSAAARFSRYLRFARRRHGHRTRDGREGREDGSGYDITDPPMPLSPEMRF